MSHFLIIFSDTKKKQKKKGFYGLIDNFQKIAVLIRFMELIKAFLHIFPRF